MKKCGRQGVTGKHTLSWADDWRDRWNQNASNLPKKKRFEKRRESKLARAYKTQETCEALSQSEVITG